jgi:Chaperone of endosialidase
MKKLFIIVFIVTTKISIAQNVGIGLTNPQTKLDISSNGDNWFDGGMSFSDNNANRYFLYKDLSNSFHIGFNGVKNLTMSNGNVGIGLTNPQTKLDISSNGNNWFDGGMSFSDDNANRYFLYKDLSNSFHIGFNGVKKLTISNGNVGIGLTNPQTKLDISSNGNNWFDGGISFSDNNANRYFLYKDLSNSFHIGFNGVKNLTISNGNVGIGTVSPTEKLQVVGNILASGTITPSDFRYKENIVNIANPLQKVKQLRGVTYYLRTSEFPEMQFDIKEQIGLVAQEVEKVLPTVVHTGNNGYKGVEYEKIVPLLIEGMKEQQMQIEFQQKQIDELKILVQKLLAR